ncbi:hypothetical protein AVEN_35285-1 [Araneus ventricosus]|uniref:Uncharacterized protein n=1 Tax=Araneus ventricosus TaxID=182803 RepID=A0A4Y2PBY5_ARAVE|nr:hypothetical protein AVEN_35285-1 [Araneus ventricosus]
MPTGMALEFARRGGDLPDRRHGLPDKGTRPAVWGDECNEIGLKFLPDYHLSTTFEYPVQKFSPMGGAQHPRQEGPGPPVPPPLAPPLYAKAYSAPPSKNANI